MVSPGGEAEGAKERGGGDEERSRGGPLPATSAGQPLQPAPSADPCPHRRNSPHLDRDVVHTLGRGDDVIERVEDSLRDVLRLRNHLDLVLCRQAGFGKLTIRAHKKGEDISVSNGCRPQQSTQPPA